jgi:Nuclear transport factor 2 (NTF2) domain
MSNWEFSRYRVMACMRSDLCRETYLRPLSHCQSCVATPELRCTCQQLRVNTLMCVSAGDMVEFRSKTERGRVPMATGIGHATTTCHIPALILPLPSQSHLVLSPSVPWPTSPTKSKCLALPRLNNADQRGDVDNSIEISTRAADHFTRLYYSAYDSSTRVDDLPNFYRPNSAVSWNGNPYEGSQGVRDLMAKMPKTQHEVQSFDCHPIPGE